ncbi:A disintegrin and metalloproteinase with thrombospondin motifs like [Prorops nasuta]|uniref:A disintegrin and metalloproteinase with thrombospondin motifs like n=1 Tax=Prorops nasuta TaxID=863751 RepID=UPI0034CF4C5F
MFKYIYLLFFVAPLLILCNVKLTESYLAAENTPVFTVKSDFNSPFGLKYTQVPNPFGKLLRDLSFVNNDPLYSLQFDASVRRQRRSAFFSGGNYGQHRPPMIAQNFYPINLGMNTGNSPQTPNIIHPRVLVTVDYSLLKKIGPNTEYALEYVLSFFLGVNMRYRMLTNPKIRFNIAGIILAQDDYAVPYVSNSIVDVNLIDVNSALNNMSSYFNADGRIDKSSHDLAVTLTNKLFATVVNNVLGNNGVAGLAFVKGACGRNRHGLVQDNGGFDGIYFAVHEIAHILGVNHDGHFDGIADKCERKYVMAPVRPLETNEFEWSACTIAAIRQFLRMPEAKCLFSPLQNLGRKVHVLLPGQLLGEDFQCEAAFGSNIKACHGNAKQFCYHLSCKTNPNAATCSYAFPAAEGTRCEDDNHFCLDGHCTWKP